MSMLVKAKQELVARQIPVVTFGNIMGHLYGKWGQVLVDILLVFTQVRVPNILIWDPQDNLSILTAGWILLRVRRVPRSKCVALSALEH
jgi:hypothetical protein